MSILIPDFSNTKNFIECNNILGIGEYIIHTSRIKIRAFKIQKIKLPDKFLYSVDYNTIKVFISPYNSDETYYLRYYLKGNYIYIETNATNYSERSFFRRYCILDILYIGKRWDKQVINFIKQKN